MIVVFFLSSGPVLIHAVEKGNTVDNTYYKDKSLGPAFESIKRQRVSSGLRGIKKYHDNQGFFFIAKSRGQFCDAFCKNLQLQK